MIVSLPDSCDTLRNASGFPSTVSVEVSALLSATREPARSSTRSSFCMVTTSMPRTSRVDSNEPILRPSSSTLNHWSAGGLACANSGSVSRLASHRMRGKVKCMGISGMTARPLCQARACDARVAAAPSITIAAPIFCGTRHDNLRHPEHRHRDPRAAARFRRTRQGSRDRIAALRRRSDRGRSLRECAGDAGRASLACDQHARRRGAAPHDRTGKTRHRRARDRGDPHADPGRTGEERTDRDPDCARGVADDGSRRHSPPRRGGIGCADLAVPLRRHA